MEWLLVLKWLLVLAALTATGAPLAAWLFPRLPRRGAAFSLPVALAGVAIVTFWVGQLTFGLHTILIGVAAVLAAGVLAFRRGARPEWSAVAGGYAVFAAGFLLLVLFRASNPGITASGDEQFLHFGLTKTLLRTPALPPEDFWFAGEPLRYYYGTQMQVTGLSMLTGTSLRFGFNFGLATFYGVLVVAAYGLAGAISQAADRSYHLGGILGAFFVAVGSASTTAVRLIFGLLPEDVAVQYGHAAFDAIRHMPYEEAVLTQSQPGEWGWFFTRYVVEGAIQEFPLYSFLMADLLGHTISTGYVVLAAALAYSYYRLPAEQLGRRLAVLVGGLGGLAGIFGFMNTWSLPTAVGLAWLAVAAADPHPATLVPGGLADRLRGPDAGTADGTLTRLGGELWRLVLAVVPAVVVGLVGVAVAAPFLVFGHVPENEGIGLFPPRTGLGPFLVLYGAILALFVGYIATRGWPAVRESGWPVRIAAVVAGAVLVVLPLTVLPIPVLAVTGPILLAGWWLVRTERAGFATVLVVAGVGLLLSMELVFAKVAPWPDGPTRWNTALKVSVQGWTLAGVAAGAIGTILLGEAREAVATLRARLGAASSPGDGGELRRAVPALLAGVLVVAVVAASSPFFLLAAANEMSDTVAGEAELTMDGMAGHERFRAQEMAAINWLDDRPGRPTVVEAPGDNAYRWNSPVSSLTGLPTLVGWTHHQENYRGRERVSERTTAVDDVYIGRWPEARAVLRNHSVQYVYVGPQERDAYGDLVREFGAHDGLSVAFENDAVTIYAVDQSALRPDTQYRHSGEAPGNRKSPTA